MQNPPCELCVQVCYALPGKQVLIDIAVPAKTTIHRAILQSGILSQVPEIDLTVLRVGIFGKLKTLETELRDRDRIEIYRPLKADPKESRRKRVEKNAGRRTGSA
ncbi:RnfH family protein [soil metagenome]